jgi:IS4 transposase
MFEDLTRALTCGLRDHIKLSTSRFETLSWLVFLMLQQGSVSLWRLAAYVSTTASTDSVRRRFYRFFQYVKLDPSVSARWLVELLSLEAQPWTLVLDRTNWDFGKTPINILMVSVMYRGLAIPLMWSLLPNRGNSRMPARIALLDQVVKTFPKARITCVIGDREFVGRTWIDWLHDKKIDFILRFKENQYVERDGYMTESISDLAASLKVGEVRIIRHWRQLGESADTKRDRIKLVILRLKDNELLALACTGNPYQALERYRRRWTIESLFAVLKTRGFNLEDTHLCKPEKLSTLLAIVAIAVAMSIKTGIAVAKIKPIKCKAHGRKEATLFSLGLQTLRKIFVRPHKNALDLIRQNLMASKTPRKALLLKALPT